MKPGAALYSPQYEKQKARFGEALAEIILTLYKFDFSEIDTSLPVEGWNLKMKMPYYKDVFASQAIKIECTPVSNAINMDLPAKNQ